MAGRSRRYRILVVDDDPAVLEMLYLLLTGAGMHVCCASSYAGARRLAATETLDVVLTDLQLGGDSGLELLREIRHLHSELPVLVMSGCLMPELARVASEAGACATIVKPFGADALLRTIACAL